MKDLIEQIKEEYKNRIDIIYTQYHNGQYWREIEEMKKRLRKQV